MLLVTSVLMIVMLLGLVTAVEEPFKIKYPSSLPGRGQTGSGFAQLNEMWAEKIKSGGASQTWELCSSCGR